MGQILGTLGIIGSKSLRKRSHKKLGARRVGKGSSKEVTLDLTEEEMLTDWKP